MLNDAREDEELVATVACNCGDGGGLGDKGGGGISKGVGAFPPRFATRLLGFPPITELFTS
jgi:hypothetical protein